MTEKKEKEDVTPILFPYSYLTTKEAMRLYLMFPRIHLLRLYKPEHLEIPDFESFVNYLLPVDDADFLVKLRKAISEDQNLVYEYSDGESMAIWEKIFEEETTESAPFQLVTQIRGRFKKTDESESILWQKAYLFQLGIELERQGIEVAEKFSHVKKLESEFKEVLGVERDETLELLEGNYNGVVRVWEYRDSSLRKRIEAWSFFCSKLNLLNPIPIIVSRSVKDEIEVLLEIVGRDKQLTIQVEEEAENIFDPATLATDKVKEIVGEIRVARDKILEKLVTNDGTETIAVFREWVELIASKIESVAPENSQRSLRVSLLKIQGLSVKRMLEILGGDAKQPLDNESNECFLLCVYPVT